MLQVPTRANQPARSRIDWEAVERDYRTGRFTLRELELKHGRSASQICRRAQAEGWTQDLRDLVRQATSAAIIRDLAAEATTSAQQSTTQTVLAAAEAIKQVIVRHRQEVAAARIITAGLMAELQATTTQPEALKRMLAIAVADLSPEESAGLQQQMRDLLRLPARIAGIQKLADTMTRLQTLERKAFGIGDDDAGTNPLDTMNEDELQAEIERLAAKLA